MNLGAYWLCRGTRRDEIRQQFVGDGRAKAGHRVPARYRVVARHPCPTVVPAGDVAEVLSGCAGCADFVDGRVDEAEWMSRHLVANGDQRGPQRRTRAGPADHTVLALVVDDEARARVGAGGNIGHTSAVL